MAKNKQKNNKAETVHQTAPLYPALALGAAIMIALFTGLNPDSSPSTVSVVSKAPLAARAAVEAGGRQPGGEEVAEDPGERLEQTLRKNYKLLDVDGDSRLTLLELDSEAAKRLTINELSGSVTMEGGLINGLVAMKQAFKIGDRDPTDGSLSYEEWLDTFVVLVKFVKGAATAEEKQAVIWAMREIVNDTPQTSRRCYAGPTICSKLVGEASGEMKRGKDIDEVKAEELTPELFYSSYLLANRPVLIKGGASKWKATKKWGDDRHLRRAVGSIEVNVERSRNRRYGQEEKSWYRSSDINDKQEDGGGGAFTWNRFLDLYRSPEPPYHYAQTEIPEALMDEVEPPQVAPCLTSWLVWAVLWVGRGGENSLLHNDQYENLYAIVDGTKKVTLIDGMEASYVYEDKYLSDAGKVSSVEIDHPNYEAHPWLRHATYTTVTVKKGDILYIPIYWWHQVNSIERSIGVTMWFDPWDEGLAAVAGSGRKRRTDLNLGIIKAWANRLRGSGKTPSCKANKTWDMACRSVGKICRQNPMPHNFCPLPGGPAVKEDLVDALKRLSVTDQGDPRTVEDFLEEGDFIRESWERGEINQAMGEIITLCHEERGGEKRTAEQADIEAKMVDAVSNRLYFENPSFLERVRQAGRDGNAETLGSLFEGFNEPEIHRVLFELFVDPSKDLGDATGEVARLMRLAVPPTR